MNNIKEKIYSLEKINTVVKSLKSITFQNYAKLNNDKKFFDNKIGILKEIINILNISFINKSINKIENIFFIGTNRGFCGNHNKIISKFLKNNFNTYIDKKIYIVGKKLFDLIPNEEKNKYFFIEKIDINNISENNEFIFINNGEVETYTFTKFINNYFSEKIQINYLPLTFTNHINKKNLINLIKNYFLEFVLINSQIEENKKRINILTQSVDNSDNLLKQLKIKSNNIKKNKITQEINEISSHRS